MTRPKILIRSTSRSCLALCAVLGGASACNEVAPAQSTESAQAQILLETVPADIACVRVTVSGGAREVVRDVEAVAGQPVMETLTGLPVGQVTFVADAYSAACTQVTKSTIPAWVGEEKNVTLTLGRLSSVGLTLVKNGRAKVTVQFEDGTVPDGGARD